MEYSDSWTILTALLNVSILCNDLYLTSFLWYAGTQVPHSTFKDKMNMHAPNMDPICECVVYVILAVLDCHHTPPMMSHAYMPCVCAAIQDSLHQHHTPMANRTVHVIADNARNSRSTWI